MLKLCLGPLIVLSLTLSFAQADNTPVWELLNGKQIHAVLAGSSMVFPEEDGATQDFESDGSTVWVHGAPTFGKWKVSDTQYCSVWPPSTAWVCYNVSINAERSTVRFIGESGKIYEGIFK